jgi:DNA-binding NarL/FixJ family response regulator
MIYTPYVIPLLVATAIMVWIGRSQPDFTVVRQAKDGLEAVALTERLQPDMVIIDILMPGLNGMDAASQIKQRCPSTKVIILSMHADESYVSRALQNGANGYIRAIMVAFMAAPTNFISLRRSICEKMFLPTLYLQSCWRLLRLG